MSFLIKCGHNKFLKQIVNISLLNCKLWTLGTIYIDKYIDTPADDHNKEYSDEYSNTYKDMYILPLVKIYSENCNNLKLIKNKDNNILLLNDTIIYQNTELFTYNIDLTFSNECDYSQKNMYHYIKYNCVDE